MCQRGVPKFGLWRAVYLRRARVPKINLFEKAMCGRFPNMGRGATMRRSYAISAAIIAGVFLFSESVLAAEPLPRAKPEEVGMSSELLGLIGKTINAEIARGQLPGGVVAV